MTPPRIEPDNAVSAHLPKDLRSYFVAFFVNPGEPREMAEDTFIRHQNYMRRQIESGVYHLAGPISDARQIRGIMILSASSVEEARTIVEADPAVVEGVLAVEVYPSVFPNLSSLKIEYP